jgi:hypothetical protein
MMSFDQRRRCFPPREELTSVVNPISGRLFKFHTREMILMLKISIYIKNLPILIRL